MPHQETDRHPRQERSRRTLTRLLSATVRTLDECGLRGATIPRIARAAGVSPATVYRRFKDKQDLLRAAFLHMLEASNEQNRKHLAKKLTRPTLKQAARRLIELSFAQYREHDQLLRALKQFLEADDDRAFVQSAKGIIDDNLDQAVRAMLEYRNEIVHADPARAVRIATLTATTAIETIAFAPRSAWGTLQPITDKALVEELARGYVAYLKSSA